MGRNVLHYECLIVVDSSMPGFSGTEYCMPTFVLSG